MCENGQIYNTETEKCECPESLPHYDGTQCLNCPGSSFWSQNALACVKCADGQHYDADLKGCVKCPLNFVYNENSGECVSAQPTCSNGKIYNTDKKQC